MNDTGLFVLLGVLHLFALAAGGGLLLLALGVHDTCPPPRHDDADGDDPGGGGHGGGGDDHPLRPPSRPISGPPLRDAQPARVRLRSRRRLADLIPRPPRRPAPHRPRHPSRTTH